MDERASGVALRAVLDDATRDVAVPADLVDGYGATQTCVSSSEWSDGGNRDTLTCDPVGCPHPAPGESWWVIARSV